MKVLKFIIICAIIFIGHDINAQQIYFSEHDVTIDKLLPKAKKNKLKDKKLQQLKAAYHQANQDDFNEIMKTKASGQPDWINIYLRTFLMEIRQNKIKELPDNIKTSINFKPLNFESEISSAKNKAERYICAKAPLLLDNPTEENLTEAKNLISLLSVISPKNKSIDELNARLAIAPAKRILFRVATPVEMHLPKDLAQIILDFDENTIYGIPFDVTYNKNTDYNIMIRIMIDEKSVSPERIDAVTFDEKNNNSSAKVTDKTMTKSATLKGEIQIIDVKNDKILVSTPYDATSTFRHNYSEISGDKDACSEHTLQLLNNEHIDFPNDNALLKGAAKELNLILKRLYLKK